MKVLLTGAGGFIGSCTLWKLNSMGITDVVLVDTAKDPSDYKTLAQKKYSSYLHRDQLLRDIREGKLDDRDLIIHLGACADTTERDQDYLRKNNFEYSRELAEWALQKNKQFHFASSASVYGKGDLGFNDGNQELQKFQPLNFYAQSKFNFDHWLIEKKLTGKVVGYRYFNVFGPNEYHKGDMRSMVCKAFDQIREAGVVKLFATSREGFGDGSETRDFVYVKDVCDVMAYFIQNPDKKGIFNVGTGKARSFKDLVMAVFKGLDKPAKIDYIPMPEKLKGQYQYFTEADLSNLRKTGYKKQFLSLEESVGDYVKNYLVKNSSYL